MNTNRKCGGVCASCEERLCAEDGDLVPDEEGWVVESDGYERFVGREDGDVGRKDENVGEGENVDK